MPKEAARLGSTLGEVCWYEVDGRSFYQATLVLGQSLRIPKYLRCFNIRAWTSAEVVDQLGEQIGEILEIVLVPKGVSQEAHVKSLDTPGVVDLADWFLERLTHVDLIRLVDDFFVCNLDSSVVEVLTRGFQGWTTPPSSTKRDSDASVPSSPEATPHTATPS